MKLGYGLFTFGLKDIMADNENETELLDYEEDETETTADGTGDAPVKKDVKGTYVSIHSSGFRDFLLKPELLRAIVDCGFEHPSEGNWNNEKLKILNWIFRVMVLLRNTLLNGHLNYLIFLLVQHECIPQAILSMDVLCQAKSGMGKTAVFVLATLQQLEPVDGQVRQNCLSL